MSGQTLLSVRLFKAISDDDLDKVKDVTAKLHKGNGRPLPVLSSTNNSGDTPLIHAIKQYNMDDDDDIIENKDKILTHLIEMGANLEQQNSKGKTALDTAIETGNYLAVRILLEKGANIDGALHKAAEFDKTAITVIELIHGWGLDVNKKNEKGETPLYIAVRAENDDAIRILREKGASFTNELHIAARDNHCQLLYALIYLEADVDAKNEKGETALHVAADSRHPKCVEELLKAKASPNILNDKKESPILIASRNGDAEIVRMIYESPLFDKNVELTNQNETIFDMAKKGRFSDTINTIIKRKFEPPNPNTLPPLKIPRTVNGTPVQNAVTFEEIEDGNILTNFRGNADNSYEKKFDRYYLYNTVERLKKHPTNKTLRNRTHYIARFAPANEPTRGGRCIRLRTVRRKRAHSVKMRK